MGKTIMIVDVQHVKGELFVPWYPRDFFFGGGTNDK